MRILEINKFFYLRRGAERHMLDVIDLLRKRGHEVAVLSMEHQENEPSDFKQYFVSYVGYHTDDSSLWQRLKGMGRLFWSFEARCKIERLLQAWQPDVAHLHNIYHQLSPSILGPLTKRGIPIVMTVHDYNLVSPDKDTYYPAVGQHYYKFLFVRKYRLVKRMLLVAKMYWNDWCGFYKNINAYIVPSTYVKNVLVGAGMSGENIFVLPHFIAESSRPETPLAPLEAAPTLPFGLYFGSVSQEKGIAQLVKIFDSLQVPLVILGKREHDFLLPKSDYVSYQGQQSKQVVEQWIEKAALVVSASPLPETFGLIALEAIALGKPFFGLMSGALPEIISNGMNGYLAGDVLALKNELHHFFSSKNSFDRESIREDALARYSEVNYGKKMEGIFEKLLIAEAKMKR